MQNRNVVIGIEGLVGSGKTSISKELLKYIPNSILIHGGNIYRAIVSGVMQSGVKFENLTKNMENIEITEIMKKLNLEVRLEDKETVVYINGKRTNNKELQSEETSMAVSAVSNVANNSKLYIFGKKLIDSFREKYNVILSSRDIMKMYPDCTYHFFITADMEERIKRKFIQYNGDITKEQIRQMIEKRDDLQEKSGYYKMHELTKVIDVTNDTIEESCKKVLQYIKIEAIV